eukprot:TRINITY_DN39066_c0_g1_i1.p1 TRINITY_DN39066_c0_g1~~TRINITY_DN39066_c0_g1_i1.p1  ORF type:complete len:365 (-),score=43.18 TRINITY_DN39066_c0_g1_i1:177-1196(-)
MARQPLTWRMIAPFLLGLGIGVQMGVLWTSTDSSVMLFLRSGWASRMSSGCGPAEVLAQCSLPSGQRHVYLDMGANWANTLRMWYDVANDRREHIWEVYAFEANPLVQPYVEKFAKWLNGAGPKPELTVPPSGSSIHLTPYAKRYGCKPDSDVSWRDCICEKFQKPLGALKPDPSLNSTSLLASRLADAEHPAICRSRYTFVPAAVWNSNGLLALGLADAKHALYGGAKSDSKEGRTLDVFKVDVVSWMIQNFRKEDYVILKIDAEGAEHPILGDLLDKGKFDLIDELLMECHGNCSKLNARLQHAAQETGAKILREGSAYPGYDHCSTPDLLRPIEPI